MVCPQRRYQEGANIVENQSNTNMFEKGCGKTASLYG